MNKPEPIFSTRSNLGMRTRAWKKLGEGVLILLAFAYSFWLMFHTFSYNAKTNEMRIAFKLWSDFAAHVPLIRSFSMGPNFDRLIHFQTIEYPIYPGEPIRYHFLFDMIVGLLERAGLRIDWALNIPSIIGFSLLIIGIYIVAKKLFSSSATALLSVLFFLFNGSLSFLQFFQKHPLSISSWRDIMEAREFPAFAPWGPGDVTAFWNLNIYTNQRHLAGAFAFILFFILTCLRIEHKPFRTQVSWALVWAILIGFLPYYHQPALLIMAVIMTTYFLVFPKLRPFLFATGIWSFLLIIPQLFNTGGAGVSWYPGYIIHNEIYELTVVEKIGRMVIFWWNNLGLHSVLMLLGVYFMPKQTRWILLPMLPIFLIGNLFTFSIEASANHKFFNFVMILGNMISAYTLVLLFNKIKIRLPARHRFAQAIAGGFAYLCICVFLILLTLSGVIDFFVVKNDVIGSVKDIQADETAMWIAKNTPRDAIFLNSSYMYHPASLAGRSIFLGWPYFAWSAGYPENRMPIMDTLYETKDDTQRCALLKKRNISYVTVENVLTDRDLPNIDLDYFFKTFTPTFTTRDRHYAIFATEKLCK